MPRILEDPTKLVCPNFEHAEWDFYRQPMIEAHIGDHPPTMEKTAQRVEDVWTRVNDIKVAAWNDQLEQDREEQEGRSKLDQEEEDARLDQQRREAEEQRREIEKEKPKINDFDNDRELDYFTIEGCSEASANTDKSITQNAPTFTQEEGTIAIRPLAAIRPSKHIRNDHGLSREEMMDARNTTLHYMALSKVGPEAHAKSLVYFYYALDTHPRKALANV